MLSTLSPERRTVLAQLARFIVSGAFVTALGVGVYALVALVLRWHPQLGNFLAYVVAVATGYVMHSQWSFRGHGGDADAHDQVRFVIVSLISLRAQQPVGVAAVHATSSLGARRRSCRCCS